MDPPAVYGSSENVTLTDAWISCSPGATGTAPDVITRAAISGRGDAAPASCTATTRPTFSDGGRRVELGLRRASAMARLRASSSSGAGSASPKRIPYTEFAPCATCWSSTRPRLGQVAHLHPHLVRHLVAHDLGRPALAPHHAALGRHADVRGLDVARGHAQRVPSDCSTCSMAWLLAARAWAAVGACVTTPEVISAMSGAAVTVPVPTP